MLKSKSTKIDLCGIPVIMSYQKLKEQPILVLCLRYLDNQKQYLTYLILTTRL